MFEPRCSVAAAILLVLFPATTLAQFRPGNAVRRPATDSSREPEKAALPDAESREKATALMQEIYKDKLDAATSAAAQKQLARALMSKALEMTNDPPSCYVLLSKAGSLAFKARDYDLALEVIDALDNRFDLDALSLRIKVMTAEDANAETPSADRCALAIHLMAEAAAKGRPDVAVHMGELAQKAADESQKSALVKFVGDYKSRLEKSLRDKKTETDLLARLKTSPADPEANLALGKLYCFQRGNWDKGMPLLALSSDSALKQLAEKELARPFDSAGMLGVGDGWWELAQKNAPQEKSPLLGRAAYWYRLAQPKLAGLLQVKVEKRLAEIEPLVTAPETSDNSLVPVRGLYGWREPALRPIVVVLAGGTTESERAVRAALVWLANHQLSDGSWSLQNYTHRCKARDRTCTGTGEAQHDAGATAMGLLPFLAAGHTHKSKGPYKETVDKGITWLIKRQKADGCLASGEAPVMYSHGLATIALCEAYGLTADKNVGRAAQGAVNYILKAQNAADGGWRDNPGDPGDTSVVGWQLTALKSARMAGLDIGGSSRSGWAFAGTSKWLDSVAVHDGTEYAYQPGNPPINTMTSVGLLCRQYLGTKRGNPMLTGGMAYLMNNLPDEGRESIYYWYYATQVMHNMSGYGWHAWNRKMRDLLIHTQVRNTEQCANGSWDPKDDLWGKRGGRVMQTALSCLTLEIYYRYPP
jgi:hypothetical protein